MAMPSCIRVINISCKVGKSLFSHGRSTNYPVWPTDEPYFGSTQIGLSLQHVSCHLSTFMAGSNRQDFEGKKNQSQVSILCMQCYLEKQFD